MVATDCISCPPERPLISSGSVVKRTPRSFVLDDSLLIDAISLFSSSIIGFSSSSSFLLIDDDADFSNIDVASGKSQLLAARLKPPSSSEAKPRLPCTSTTTLCDVVVVVDAETSFATAWVQLQQNF